MSKYLNAGASRVTLNQPLKQEVKKSLILSSNSEFEIQRDIGDLPQYAPGFFSIMSNINLDGRDNAKTSNKKKLPRINRNDDLSDRIERQVKANKTYNGNSRKNQISINHLLDFLLYRDLPEYHQNHHRPRRVSSNRPRSAKKKLYLHGMRFINVNYKFVVDHRKSYKPQQIDPNVPVDTQDILRIIVPKGNACPICLSEELVAPRMVTSCGHILCLTCLLSLLESEVPTNMKKESKVIVEKYNDCPLCGSIIRKRDVKPVQIDNVDERFEVPKIGDEVVLSLMTRIADSVVPIPRWLDEVSSRNTFPWASQTDPDLSQFLRFFKGDFAYISQMYEQEKQDLREALQFDKETYNDDGKFYKLAIKSIDNDLLDWASKFASDMKNNSHQEQVKPTPETFQPTFYYFQTGFKSSTTYVLSPLDMKVLKTSYNLDYTQLPFSVIAKVENIKYEELDSETVASKYKYLLHLPLGTSIGFLECNWQNNEFVSQELWEAFKTSLQKRTKQTSKKFKKEELDRRRAMNEEERRAREYIERENSGNSRAHDYHYDSESWMPLALFGSLTISDHRDLPPLSGEGHGSHSSNNSANVSDREDAGDAPRLEKSVWGMQIPKSERNIEGDEEDAWDAEEMIRKAREEIARHEAENPTGKKKKKKKFILLSS
mgnify:FL=1